MSLRAMRRSVFAASAVLSIGGALAVASSASAAQIPLGSSTDTGSTTLFGLQNQANNGLLLAENLIVATGIDTAHFSTAFTSASQLTSTNVPEIGSDFAVTATSNPTNFYELDTAWCETPSVDGGAGQSPSTCTSNGGLPPDSITTTFTGTIQTGVAGAAANWANLGSLVSVSQADPTDFPGGLFTVDGDVSVSSTATVTGIGQPTAYSATFGVSGPAAKGFVIPNGFTLTFPANFNVNVKLVSAEIQASQITNPPAASAIGTASVTSPEIAALVPGSKGVDSTAQVFVVATASLTQPEFEIYLGQGDYILGTLSGVTFPLTVNFGQPVFNGNPTPLPVSSVSLNFPAATSPLEATSCTDLGSLNGTMTDSLTTLASTYFGDSTDGGAIPMASTPTVVTNDCATTAGAPKPKNTLSGSASGLTSGHPTVTLKVKANTAFNSETVGLPGGLKFVKSKTLAKEISVSGAKVKSVKIAGGKLVITLKSKVKSDTIKTKKGLISESAALIKSIKKHKTKKLTFSVRAGSASIKASVKA